MNVPPTLISAEIMSASSCAVCFLSALTRSLAAGLRSGAAREREQRPTKSVMADAQEMS